MLPSPNNTHNPSKDICRPFPQGIGDLDRVIRIESERKTLCDTAPPHELKFRVVRDCGNSTVLGVPDPQGTGVCPGTARYTVLATVADQKR